ncbi:hypothetical protein BDZ94DRAFT_238102 [Collybia nuda]|uniref:BTB domain-containing protein n=1 Tax=Collybia nuda TaxID=64659 RepID=A0A9P5XTB9_9AGAR|nr:hypothetical protein BDZ94DRAFT_238102 [Collybia nuda]
MSASTVNSTPDSTKDPIPTLGAKDPNNPNRNPNPNPNPNPNRNPNPNSNRNPNDSNDDQTVQHPVYWFDDGSFVFRVAPYAFKVHRTLLTRHSRFFARLCVRGPEGGEAGTRTMTTTGPGEESREIVDLSVLEPGSQRAGVRVRVRVQDVEALLGFLYHDTAVSGETPVHRTLSLLRVTGPRQFDFPGVFAVGRGVLLEMFGGCFELALDWEVKGEGGGEWGEEASAMDVLEVGDLGEALALANEFKIGPMRKVLYYHLVTSPESSFDADREGEEETASSTPSNSQTTTTTTTLPAPTPTPTLSKSDKALCTSLMTNLISHFTPTLFTPPATSHMACTDALAGAWMARVIQPALEAGGGVHRPMETLGEWLRVDWEREGVCGGCALEKRREWVGMRREVWGLVGGWLGVD